jgi:hypothetical protein
MFLLDNPGAYSGDQGTQFELKKKIKYTYHQQNNLEKQHCPLQLSKASQNRQNQIDGQQKSTRFQLFIYICTTQAHRKNTRDTATINRENYKDQATEVDTPN